MSDRKQAVNFQVENIIEAKLEESEAFCHGVFSNNRKGWVYFNFFQWRKKLVSKKNFSNNAKGVGCNYDL